MSPEIITEFLGAFKIRADTEARYLEQRAIILQKIKDIGIEVISLTPIKTDIETASQEWEQWNKIDQIFEEEEEAKASSIEVTEDSLFIVFPKLQEQLEVAAEDLGISFDNFEYLQILRRGQDFEIIYQDIEDDNTILCADIGVDSNGNTSIRDLSLEETFFDEDSLDVEKLVEELEPDIEDKDDDFEKNFFYFLDEKSHPEISDNVLDD